MAKRGGSRRAPKARKGRRGRSASRAGAAKPLFIRGSGGRFAGSRKRPGSGRLSGSRTSLTVRAPSGRKYKVVRTSRVPLSLRPGKISARSARHITTRISRADARGRQYGSAHPRASRAAGRSITTRGHYIIGRV